MTTAYPPDGAPLAATLPRRRPRTLAWTSVVLSAALIAASVALVDAQQVLERLEATDPRWLLAFFATYVVQIVLLGLRWSTISRALGVPLGWRRASAEYSLSILVNQLLPTGVAGDGWRAVRHARRAHGHPFARIIEALALDRVSGQMALLLVALASVPWTLEHGLIRPELLWMAAALLAACLVLVIALARNAPASGGFASRARGFLLRAAAALAEPRRAFVHLSISLVLIATCLAQLAFAAHAIGLDLDVGQLLWLGPLILLATSVPSFFGGWGIREGASALLFHTVGLGGSSGVALSLLFGAFALVCAMPGFMVLLFEGQFSRRRRERQGVDVTWSNAHAVAMLGGTALAVALHTSLLLWFVGALSLLFFIARSRGAWTKSGNFGLANTVTTLRLFLTLALLGGVDREPGHIAAAIALLILGLDLVDGWLARRYGADSPFGACYDMEVDAMFVLSLSCTLWARGVAGPWVLLAGLWRYLFVVIPLFIPSRGGEAPRSIYYRSAYTVMVLSFVLSLALPAPFASALATLGTIVLSASFLRSFYYRYRPPDDAARGA